MKVKGTDVTTKIYFEVTEEEEKYEGFPEGRYTFPLKYIFFSTKTKLFRH